VRHVAPRDALLFLAHFSESAKDVSALLETMHERKVPPDSVTYAMIIDLYLKQGADGMAAAV
jgi:hypothetical protein